MSKALLAGLLASLNLLAQAPARLESPVWSRDGKEVMFSMVSVANNTEWNIYIESLDGARLRQLTKTGGWDAAWSADASTIAFVSSVEGKRQIFTMAADGSNRRQISAGDGEYFHPAWSPSGAALAFTCRKNGSSRICVMNSDGSNVRQLTPIGQQCRWPAWSPDAKQIAYNSQGEVWVIEMTSGERRRLFTAGAESTTVDWSPDGSEILYSADVGHQIEIDAYNLQLGKVRAIPAGDWRPREPRWSPDGKRILFYSNGTQPGIYYLNLNDSSVNAVRLEASSHIANREVSSAPQQQSF